MKTHYKKILPKYFKSVNDGSKPFEIRKDDCNYQENDTLVLQEYINNNCISGRTGKEIIKEITYKLTSNEFPEGIKEGYCILGLKQEGIKLVNIDLTGWNGLEQCEKINEELEEFLEATADCIILNTQETKEHAIEEFFDVVQSSLGLLAIAGISAEEIMKEYPKHLEKLKNRPRRY